MENTEAGGLVGRYFTVLLNQTTKEEGLQRHGFQIVNQIGPQHYEIETVGRGGIELGKEKSTHWVVMERENDREIISVDDIEWRSGGLYYTNLNDVETDLAAWSMVRCLEIDNDPGWQRYKDYVFSDLVVEIARKIR